MKAILYVFILVGIPISLQAGSNVIRGPIKVCPGQSVNYEWEVGFNVANCVAVAWTLKQNGIVLLSQSRNGTDPNVLKWNFVWPVTTSPGLVTIEVEGSIGCCFQILCDYQDYINVTVGLDVPGYPIGVTNICPNGSAAFNSSPVNFATSYTWNVPNSGWKVNGISGPSVSGQGTNVQITSPSTGVGNYSIKVKAVSPTCGESAYSTKSIALDYPVDLFAGSPGATITEFTADPAGQIQYTWILPAGWTKVGQQYNEVYCRTNGKAGTLKVNVKTLCNNIVADQVYFNPNANLNGLNQNLNASFYPNPASNEFTIEENINAETVDIMILNSSGVEVKKLTLTSSNKTVNVADLSPGVYYVKYFVNNKELIQRIYKE